MSTDQQTLIIVKEKSIQKLTSLNLRIWLLVFTFVVGFSWLSLYNLQFSPVTWFDEGEHLRVPKTLLQYGQYAVWSSDGFRYFGPTIGVGPTVILPIALVFKLFGIGLIQGRAVIVIYLAVATLLYWLYGLKLLGARQKATFALAFLLTAPGIDYIAFGRQVVGEIPAFVFFLAGLLAWWKAGQTVRQVWKWLFLASVLWALAAITKSDYGLLLPPTITVAWLANRFYYKQAGWNWKYFALPFVMVAGGLAVWYFLVLTFLGGGDFNSNLTLLRNASGGSAFVFSIPRMASALKFLFGPTDMWGLSIPGLLYGIWLSRRSKEGFKLGLPLIFCLVWLAWFSFASVGWPRYAFPALAICPLFTARLIYDMPQLLTSAFKQLTGKYTLISRILACGVAILIISGLVTDIQNTLQNDDSAQQMAAYLNQNVSKLALVETWESELGFLTDHRYHYPPPDMLDKAVRLKWLGQGGTSLVQLYHPEKLNPDYLVAGAFSQWNDLYPAELLSSRYKLIVTFGNYTLYQRVN